jgi:hypothetical protein
MEVKTSQDQTIIGKGMHLFTLLMKVKTSQDQTMRYRNEPLYSFDGSED